MNSFDLDFRDAFHLRALNLEELATIQFWASSKLTSPVATLSSNFTFRDLPPYLQALPRPTALLPRVGARQLAEALHQLRRYEVAPPEEDVEPRLVCIAQLLILLAKVEADPIAYIGKALALPDHHEIKALADYGKDKLGVLWTLNRILSGRPFAFEQENHPMKQEKLPFGGQRNIKT